MGVLAIIKDRKLDKHRIQFLFDKYLKGTLTESEEEEFDVLMADMEERKFLDMVDRSVDLGENRLFERDKLFEEIMTQIEDEEPVPLRSDYSMWRLMGRVAATVLLAGLLGIVAYKLGINDRLSDSFVSTPALKLPQDIELPKDDALITLADGKRLSLADVGKDTLHYKGLALSRGADGTIVMQQEKEADFFMADEKHRFVAPKGVTLRLMLPDGSVVNLNSDSQVEIYASFGKRQRELTLSGEAFFEVAHDKTSPFVVKAKNTAVKVLGTTFNMSAYKVDKIVSTTLVMGSVEVASAKRTLQIEPGQQARVDQYADMQLDNNVDMRRVLAWREGYFRFRDEPIRNIMTDLSKWYSIEGVEFLVGSTDRFTGSVKRSKKLSDVLANIEQVSDLRFKIQEGRVTVMK